MKQLFLLLFIFFFEVNVCTKIGCFDKVIHKDKVIPSLYFIKLLSKVKNEISEIEESFASVEEVIYADCYALLESMYNKLVDFCALYFGGMALGSRVSLETLFFDLMRDLSQVIKILGVYAIKIIQSRDLKFAQKVKKISILIGLTAVLALWIKELLRLKNKNSQSKLNSHNYYNVNTIEGDASIVSPPAMVRPRPPLRD